MYEPLRTVFRNLYIVGMDNITALRPTADAVRATRAAFVHQALKSERWSIRQAALQLGMNHAVLASRVNGSTPLLADEVEGIAHLLKRDPAEFFAAYLNAGTTGPTGSNPRTLVPKVAGSTPVGGTHHSFTTRHATTSGNHIAPITPISSRARTTRTDSAV
jgi:hypothetical protein